jgi:hypothetical protein
VKELASMMARQGIVPTTKTRRLRRRERREGVAPPEPPPEVSTPPGRRLANAFQPVPPSEAKNPESVYRVPDSWEPKGSVKKPLPVDEPPLKKVGRKPKPSHKRRKQALSFTVSEEEAFYLRKYASDKGLNFSEWARVVLFKAMDREIPDRP